MTPAHHTALPTFRTDEAAQGRLLPVGLVEAVRMMSFTCEMHSWFAAASRVVTTISTDNRGRGRLLPVGLVEAVRMMSFTCGRGGIEGRWMSQTVCAP